MAGVEDDGLGSCFVIADITDAKSIPPELMSIIPKLPSVPVQPLLQAAAGEYGMFNDFRDYPSVLGTFRYETIEDVCAALSGKVITPAEEKVKERDERRKAIERELAN